MAYKKSLHFCERSKLWLKIKKKYRHLKIQEIIIFKQQNKKVKIEINDENLKTNPTSRRNSTKKLPSDTSLTNNSSIITPIQLMPLESEVVQNNTKNNQLGKLNQKKR